MIPKDSPLSQIAGVLGTARPNFLLLPPMCVALGASAAWATHGTIDGVDFTLALIGALLAHASVNLLNEYDDYSSGLDAMTDRTPFSGGSGVLPAQPQLASATRAAGWTTLLGTMAIGIYFVVEGGWGLLPLGLAGVITVVAYTRWITHQWLVCLLAPGLGFGPFMVMGTAFVLTGEYTPLAALVSLTPLFLVSNLLLLNQFPDVEPDQKVGRRHLPIVGGRTLAAKVYAAFLLLAFAPIVAGLALGWLPAWAALGLLTAPAGLVLIPKVLRHAEEPAALVPFMGLNVVLCLATPLLLAVGLYIGAAA